MPPENEFLLSLHVSSETLQQLEHYHGLLLKWQRAINLVSSKTLSQAWERHFVDSAQLLPLIPNHMKIIADLGSGAGFPGLVLAILNPHFEVCLIESDSKKCEFLRTVSRETTRTIRIFNERVENCQNSIQPGLVTARALAPVKDLLGYCQPWAQSNPDLQMLFLKGESVEKEIEEAQSLYKFTYELFPSETDPQGKILRAQFS